MDEMKTNEGKVLGVNPVSLLNGFHVRLMCAYLALTNVTALIVVVLFYCSKLSRARRQGLDVEQIPGRRHHEPPVSPPVRATSAEEQGMNVSSSEPSVSTPAPALVEVDPGMVEVSIALAGIATALAALLPETVSVTERGLVAFFAGCLAVFSAYSALWLLARYCLGKTSDYGFQEIYELLRDQEKGPYWFMALSLVIWLISSFFIAVFVSSR